MSNRVDQLEKHYSPIETCDKWISRLFWVCAAFSVGVPYVGAMPFVWSQQAISILFIVAVVVHSIISHYNSFYLIPTADGLRRKQLLSNAFGVPLTPEKTVEYYNNEITPSVTRLGACILENTFFAKNVCHEMAKKERMKVLTYFLLWIVAISYRSTDLGLILTLTQLLFSGEIFIHWIKIEMLRMRNDAIYNDLYSHFLNRVSPAYLPGIASLLNSFASYESAKASASIKQSSEIFDKLNPKLSAEWAEICKQLEIDKLNYNNPLQATSDTTSSTVHE